MTTASVVAADLPLEQRFERLAEKYRALKQHYEVTRKLLEDKMVEKQPDRSSFGSFFGGNTPDPNEVLVLKEELEQKILENERLVIDLSEGRRNLEISQREISDLRGERDHGVQKITDLENSLEIRVVSEQRAREEFRSLEISHKEISDQRASALTAAAELRTLLDRKELETASLQQEISDLKSALQFSKLEVVAAHSESRKFQEEISDLHDTIQGLQGQLAVQPAVPTVEISDQPVIDVSTRQSVAQLQSQNDFLGERNRGLLEELNRAAALVARERIAKETAVENFGTSELAKRRIAEELETLRNAYEQQMDVLTESLAATRAHLDEIEQLKNACSHCGTVAKCQHAICDDCHAGGFLSRTFFH